MTKSLLLSRKTYDLAVAKNVRAARLLAGISQETAGGALGVTFQQFQKYEKGVNRISAGTLWRLSQILGCPLKDLVGDGAVNGESGLQRLVGFLQTRDGVRLASAFGKIKNPAVRHTILELIEQVSE